ncbi:MAG: insulinase family protein [Chlamydiae bacterium]|nr:insulinase family protein [Chlamydiota bacterium]MBI3277063.1 insulinase family protein [Chlamydiota bacterium]
MKYILEKLKNGVRLVLCPMRETRSVTMGVWIGVGGRYETDALCGVSHFLEHMLFKGTKTRTAVQISQAIEGVGGSMNAFTTEETTCFYAKVMNEHFGQAFEVLADMVENAAFRPQDIEKERGVILEELRMNLDVPAHYVFELLGRVMWPKHPLGRMLIGSEKTIRGLKRSDFLKFKNENYTARNIVISIAGRMDVDHVLKEASQRFNFLDEKEGALKFLPVVEHQVKPQYQVHSKKTEQTHFCIGIRAFHRNHPDRFALRVLNAALGENMSSRLFQVIREKLGLSYDISSTIERFSDTGSLVISAGVTKGRLNQALEGTLRELEKFKKKLLSKDELNMVKEYCIGQTALGMEKTSNQMVYMGESELCSGQILSLDELLRRMRAVTAEDVERVAHTVFTNERLNLSVVGPMVKEKEIANLFRLN